jgi:hypothetical protein
MSAQKLFVGLALCAVAFAACGGSSDSTSNDERAAPTTSVTTVAPTETFDGLYVLSGTQTCKSALGGEPNSSPLFGGSSLAVSGDTATVNLRNDPLEASFTTDGDSFHVNLTYSPSSSAPITTVPGGTLPSTALILDLTGTITPDGQVTGKGFDTGVNCEYDFNGSRAIPPGTPPSTGDMCGGSAGLAKAVAAAPRADGLTFTAADVNVEAMTPNGQVARYGIGNAAGGFAECESAGWKLFDELALYGYLCDHPESELTAQLELECAGSTPTTSGAAATTPPSLSSSCDGDGALAKTIELHPESPLRSMDAVLACEGGWAVVTWGDGEADINAVLRERNGEWVAATPADNVCAATGVPEQVRLYACMTN